MSMNGNGHTNGNGNGASRRTSARHKAREKKREAELRENGHGGIGALRDGLEDSKQAPETMGMIRRYVKKGTVLFYDVNPDVNGGLPNIVAECMARARKDGDGDLLLSGVKTIMAMNTHNLKAAVEEDKAKRLDDGDSTENVSHDLQPIRFPGGREL